MQRSSTRSPSRRTYSYGATGCTRHGSVRPRGLSLMSRCFESWRLASPHARDRRSSSTNAGPVAAVLVHARAPEGPLMTPLHRTMTIIGLTAFLVIATGLIVRRRLSVSWFFGAYIAFGLVVMPMFVWLPSRFYRQWFFLVIQTGADVLKFGIALEIAWRTFRPFPAARSAALLAALMILGVTLLAAAAVPIGADAWEWETVIGCLFPRVKAGTIWLMAATLLFVRWYHVPIEPFRAAILTTFACYVGFSAVLLSLSRGAFIARAPLIGT